MGSSIRGSSNLTFARQAGRTLVDAQLTTYLANPSNSACDASDKPPLPELAALAGSRSGVVEFFSGFGPGNGASVIVLDTELDAPGVLGHYAQQLEAAPLLPDLSALWRAVVESSPEVSLFSPHN